ncbi:restriction endonuclease subunit S [Shewanella sp.]|uniref:restriction endonuclease subunit S n=1 Tax=Shewanella sp. TaxID=50422 RepID=UPI004054094D
MNELKASKYQAYPEYKDSGVEWLDEIPKHWVLSRVKYIAPFQVGWTPPTKNDENFVGNNLWANISDLKEKIITNTAKQISDKAAKEASMSITPKGSLMYSFKLSVGAVSFAGDNMYTNEAIASFLDSARLSLSYLYYALPKFVVENASTNIYGARILNQELISNAQVLEPTFEEAENIAKFLDHETAKIDTLIDKQQQLIKLLKEKRQAVISHAVTKGISNKEHPQAPMKDSGVEWLGEVPAHWDSCLIKYKCSEVTDGAHISPDTNGGEHYFVSIRDIKDGVINFEEALLTSPKSYQYLVKTGCLPFDGDILFSKDGTIGQTAITPKDIEFVVASSLIIIRPDREKVTPEFLDFLLQSSVVKEQVESFVKGAALRRLSIQNLLKVFGVFPPLEEQVLIAEFIQHQLSKYRVLECKAIEQVALLKERRTVLISAAVTGKIDVRNWVNPTETLEGN